MEQKTSFELLIENEDMEESHYVHTMNDFVSLIQVYGFEKVIKDLRSKMGELEW